MGAGGGFGGPDPAGQNRWTNSQSWTYQSNIDPEEFFRKIFGSQTFHDFESDNFAENKQGFGAAKEVLIIRICYMYFVKVF